MRRVGEGAKRKGFLSKAFAYVGGFLARTFRGHDVTFVLLLITAAVFCLLIFMKSGVKWKLCIECLKEMGDFILMSLVVAFLAVVLWRVEKLKEAMDDHRHEWERSSRNLRDFGGSVSSAQLSLERASEAMTRSMSLSEALRNIWDRFALPIERQTATGVIAECAELAQGWVDLILPRERHADAAATDLERLCWKLAFDSYMGEELRDLRGEGREENDPPGPILATNYPTYLRFLKRISEEFTTAALKAGRSPCFLCLANTLPVEWIMICKRRESVLVDCEVDPRLADWRLTSGALANRDGVEFRRIFLMAETDDLMQKYSVPSRTLFQTQLGLHVWTRAEDLDMKRGIDGQIQGMRAMHDTIRVRTGGKCLLVTLGGSPKGNGRRLVTPAKSLRQVVVNELHSAPQSRTARIAVINPDLDAQAAACPVRPTDLMIVGTIPDQADARLPLLAEKIEPLIAVECRTQDPWSNVSVLALYNRRHIASHLVKWYGLIEQCAQRVP